MPSGRRKRSVPAPAPAPHTHNAKRLRDARAAARAAKAKAKATAEAKAKAKAKAQAEAKAKVQTEAEAEAKAEAKTETEELAQVSSKSIDSQAVRCDDDDDDESSDLEEGALNRDLCKALEEHFRPKGVVAFSRCCRLGCTGTYGENPNFEEREKGIYFIRLHLAGMNYDPNPKDCYAHYVDFTYLMDNWDEERKLLTQFCRIVYKD